MRPHDPYCNKSECCGPIFKEEVAQIHEKVASDPITAIRRLSDGKPSLGELSALSNLAATHLVIARSGGISLFIRYVLEGYELPDPPLAQRLTDNPAEWWYEPLKGIMNSMIALEDAPKKLPGDARLLQEIKTSYDAICSVLLKDISSLYPPGFNGDMHRTCVLAFMDKMHHIARYSKSVGHISYNVYLTLTI
jgi:hypothetical protein